MSDANLTPGQTGADELLTLHGRSVLVLSPAGPSISSDRDAVDVIAKGWEHQADLVVIPLTRLPPTFFDLSTRVAGAVVQKFVDYRCPVVVLGDIGAQLEKSEALQAFVRESNRGGDLWFLVDTQELDARLASAASPV